MTTTNTDTPTTDAPTPGTPDSDAPTSGAPTTGSPLLWPPTSEPPVYAPAVSATASPTVPGNSAGAEVIVSVKNLVKKYGNFTAVADVSFDVRKGAIFGLIGPNGAGKSTTFSVIASLLLPTSGSATVAGFSATSQLADVRKLIGYMPDQLCVYGNLTA